LRSHATGVLRVWKLPFADYAAAAFILRSLLLLVSFYERSTPVARERVRADPPIRSATAKPEGQVKYRFPWF
jgi:hypothetical protein